jgi:hypothetical protein
MIDSEKEYKFLSGDLLKEYNDSVELTYNMLTIFNKFWKDKGTSEPLLLSHAAITVFVLVDLICQITLKIFTDDADISDILEFVEAVNLYAIDKLIKYKEDKDITKND